MFYEHFVVCHMAIFFSYSSSMFVLIKYSHRGNSKGRHSSQGFEQVTKDIND